MTLNLARLDKSGEVVDFTPDPNQSVNDHLLDGFLTGFRIQVDVTGGDSDLGLSEKLR
jgi:hypothetical protein